LAPRQTSIYKPTSIEKKNNFLATPLFWSIVFMIIVFAITYSDFKKNKRSRWLDFSLFFVTGIAGVVIFFLWFLTDHTATADNYNILWAFPLNLNIAFLVWRNKPFSTLIERYILFLLFFVVAVVIIWVLRIQIFSPVIAPILLALVARYAFLYFNNRNQTSQKST